MRLFVDTSALIAGIDREQPHHGEVRAAFDHLSSLDDLISTELIVTEAVAIVQRRHGRVGLEQLERFLEGLQVIWISPAAFQRALAETIVAGSRVSFVDRTSFAFMREHRIDVALTLDRDFAQAGFETLP